MKFVTLQLLSVGESRATSAMPQAAPIIVE